mmetsp:Transcript_32482/g.68312  ORF Transcript_32482/g.68312 Transcript_32482/m.68312 type:complete len:244 (+) Transcript_32482:462-1193(+)
MAELVLVDIEWLIFKVVPIKGQRGPVSAAWVVAQDHVVIPHLNGTKVNLALLLSLLGGRGFRMKDFLSAALVLGGTYLPSGFSLFGSFYVNAMMRNQKVFQMGVLLVAFIIIHLVVFLYLNRIFNETRVEIGLLSIIMMGVILAYHNGRSGYRHFVFNVAPVDSFGGATAIVQIFRRGILDWAARWPFIDVRVSNCHRAHGYVCQRLCVKSKCCEMLVGDYPTDAVGNCGLLWLLITLEYLWK